MKFLIIVFSFLLLTSYGWSCANAFAISKEGGPSGVVYFLNIDDYDIEEEEEEEETTVVNGWDLWLLFFARDPWGQEQTFEPSDGNVLGASIRWVWEQLPSIDGMALAAAQEAFVREYNLLLTQEGPEGIGVQRAQVCLEQIYYQFVYHSPTIPIAAWLIPALEIVRNRQFFARAANCLR